MLGYGWLQRATKGTVERSHDYTDQQDMYYNSLCHIHVKKDFDHQELISNSWST